MKRFLLALALLPLALLAGVTWLSAQSSVVTNPNVTGLSANLASYKVTASYTQFAAAAVTSDLTLVSLPPKSQIIAVVADLTTQFNCASVCTGSSLSMMVGTAAGGSQVMASGLDLDLATTQFGLADANMGSGLTRAAAIQGGLFGSWTAATPIVMRLTSGVGNVGNGTVTNLSQGSVTFYVLVRRF